MSELSLGYTAVANTQAPSAGYNLNNADIVTWSNTIDHSNTVNSTGFWASDIKPLTAAAATFGLTAVGVGYTFLANDATAIPLTVSAIAGQTADIQDWTLTSGGTKAMWLDATGIFRVGANSTGAFVAGDAEFSRSSTTGAIGIGGVSSSCVIDFGVTTTGVLTLSSTLFNVGRSNIGTSSNVAVGSTNSASIAYGFGSQGGAGFYTTIGSDGTLVSGTGGSAMAVIQRGGSSCAMALEASTGNLGISGPTYNHSSSAAIKQNIQPLTYDSIAIIKSLTVKSWQPLGAPQDAPFMAGPIQEEMPAPLNNGNGGVSMTSEIGILFDAVQKLIAHVGL